MNILKRISVKKIIDETIRVAKRFPLPFVFSLITTILLIIKIENFSYFRNDPLLDKSIFLTILGYGFTLVSTLFIEKSSRKDKIKFIVQLIVLGFLGYLFMTLPDRFRDRDYITFSVFQLSALIALMFVFVKKDDDDKYFGIFNVTIFMRGFISFIFAGIMFIGLGSAIYAVQELLLKDNFHFEIYGDLWVILISFFSPVFFMAGLPETNSDVSKFEYPKALKVLLQYFVFPLVGLYLLILYIYGIKIIFTRDWPEGIVTYLIISYSFVGILSIILMSPLADDDRFKWLKTFSKNFFRILIPLIILLFMAISKRIGQYGITEKRYFIFLLALWLAGITLYFIISRNRKLKLLPLTLSILCILSLYGPWSCFNISKNSQSSRLKDILIKNELLVNDKIVKTEKELPFEDRKSISSIVAYFYDNHGITEVDYLKPSYQKFAQDPKFNKDSLNSNRYYLDNDYAVLRTEFVKEAFGFQFITRWQTASNLKSRYYSLDYNSKPVIENITDYEYSINLLNRYMNDSIYIPDSDIYIKLERDSGYLDFKRPNTLLGRIDMNSIVKERFDTKQNLTSNNNITLSEMTFESKTDPLDYKLIFNSFTMQKNDKTKEYKLKNPVFKLHFKLNTENNE